MSMAVGSRRSRGTSFSCGVKASEGAASSINGIPDSCCHT